MKSRIAFKKIYKLDFVLNMATVITCIRIWVSLPFKPLNVERRNADQTSVHFHVYTFRKKRKRTEQDYIKGFWTSSKSPEAGSSVQFGNVAVSLQDLLMWQLIHTFLKNPIQDEMNQNERCGRMINAVNELIDLRGFVSKAAVQRNKTTGQSPAKT